MNPDLHEQAVDALRKWWRAWAERDLDTVQGMLDPEYSEHSETAKLGPGGHTELAQLLEEARKQAADVSISDWEIYDTVTKLFENTVVCCYCFRISGHRGRRRFTFVGRATDVLSLKEKRWTVVSHHGTLDRT